MAPTRCGTILVMMLCLLAPGRAPADDTVLSTVVDEVDTKIFIPGDVPMLRGLVVHVANYQLSPQDRWAETCRAMRFAHLALAMDMKRTNRPVLLRKALDAGLKEFAEKSGHPELVNLPFAGTGHSAGGMVTTVLLKTPAQTITTSVSCAWIMDSAVMEPEAAAVPALFTLGAIPDDFKMLPDIEGKFIPARRSGLPWGLAVMWGCAHDYGNAAALFIPWIQALAEARLPRKWDPLSGPPTLREIRQEEGWLGDGTDVEGTYAPIAPWGEFKGDKAIASWLPNRYVACIWRAIMSKDSPVTLEAATTDGRTQLGAFSPKADRTLLLEAGEELLLSATVREGADVRRIEYYDGDRPVGTAPRDPWQCTWRKIAPGPHAIYAQWTTPDGRVGVSNPTLILMRGAAPDADR
ncbi:MAG: hypothetical protein NTX87_11020 [Planctomycetota bacterium]|nr:hypothetical protein [Planctomycetota bacterium]